MSKLEALEAFIEGMVPLNRAETPLTVNSFYIVDDAKQRDKMTEEFYLPRRRKSRSIRRGRIT